MKLTDYHASCSTCDRLPVDSPNEQGVVRRELSVQVPQYAVEPATKQTGLDKGRRNTEIQAGKWEDSVVFISYQDKKIYVPGFYPK